MIHPHKSILLALQRGVALAQWSPKWEKDFAILCANHDLRILFAFNYNLYSPHENIGGPKLKDFFTPEEFEALKCTIVAIIKIKGPNGRHTYANEGSFLEKMARGDPIDAIPLNREWSQQNVVDFIHGFVKPIPADVLQRRQDIIDIIKRRGAIPEHPV